MALDTAYILLTVPAASAAAAAAAIIVATAVALARAIVVALVLRGAPLGASDFNFAFNTSRNCLDQIDYVLPLGELLAAEFYVLHSRAGLEHCGDIVAAHFLWGKLRGVFRQINHEVVDRVHALDRLLVVVAFVREARAHRDALI